MDRRTKRTHDTLVHALLALIETKPYDLITVRDIIAEANVGRSTFYAHFQNKDRLLMAGFDHLLDMVAGQIHLADGKFLAFDTSVLFRHAHGHYEIYRRLVWGSGFKLLLKDGHNSLSRKIEDRLETLLSPDRRPSVPLPLFATALSGSLLVLLKWWLDRKMPYPPERMNEVFQELTMPGINLALGGQQGLSHPELYAGQEQGE